MQKINEEIANLAAKPLNIPVQIKKIHSDAHKPVYKSEEAIAADLYAYIPGGEITIPAGGTATIGTGISICAPMPIAALVFPRSGLATNGGLSLPNCTGVIDNDYTGEVMVPLYNRTSLPITVNHGDRIAQIGFVPRFTAQFVEVDELKKTTRGAGGFGSTGEK